MRRYILADNQDITRLGVESLISGEMVETSINLQSLRALLRLYPDSVVILDYTLFDFESPMQMLNLKASAPRSSWLLFSEELSIGFIRNVLLNDNTLSVVMKGDSIEKIIEAIRQTATYQSFLCQYASLVLSQTTPPETKKELLTPSEKSVLKEIAAGKSTKEIAAGMNLSFHTINTHRKNIFRKIEVNNVHEAIKYAILSGIADTSYYII